MLLGNRLPIRGRKQALFFQEIPDILYSLGCWTIRKFYNGSAASDGFLHGSVEGNLADYASLYRPRALPAQCTLF